MYYPSWGLLLCWACSAGWGLGLQEIFFPQRLPEPGTPGFVRGILKVLSHFLETFLDIVFKVQEHTTTSWGMTALAGEVTLMSLREHNCRKGYGRGRPSPRLSAVSLSLSNAWGEGRLWLQQWGYGVKVQAQYPKSAGDRLWKLINKVQMEVSSLRAWKGGSERAEMSLECNLCS